jgi:hypothetical protein
MEEPSEKPKDIKSLMEKIKSIKMAQQISVVETMMELENEIEDCEVSLKELARKYKVSSSDLKNAIKTYLKTEGVRVNYHYGNEEEIGVSPLLWVYLGLGERYKKDSKVALSAARSLGPKVLKYLKKLESYQRKTLLKVLDSNKSYVFKKVRFEKDAALSISIHEDVAEELKLKENRVYKIEIS